MTKNTKKSSMKLKKKFKLFEIKIFKFFEISLIYGLFLKFLTFFKNYKFKFIKIY